MRFVLRRHAHWLALTAAFLLTGLLLLKWNHLTPLAMPTTLKARESLSEEAGNSTLGFGSVYFINMPKRYDRLDALSLQAHLSGLSVTQYPAVEPSMIDDVGMPPAKVSIRDGEKGCWRAHANVWSTVIRDKLPPVLILESDATWDINIRRIVPRLSENLRQLLHDTKSAKISVGDWRADLNESLSGRATREKTDDPWLSEHWDVLSLGHCLEAEEKSNISMIYQDPSVPPGQEYFGRALDSERVVKRALGLICLTAYAVSQTGAAKLLLKSAIGLNAPVDLIINQMVADGELVAYTVTPPMVTQWKYKPNIGMNQRGSNSDINGAGQEQAATEDTWREVEQSGSVWIKQPTIKDVALDVAWQRIFGERTRHI